MKNLSRGKKIALIVVIAVLLSGGATGTVFGVRRHNKKKAKYQADAVNVAAN